MATANNYDTINEKADFKYRRFSHAIHKVHRLCMMLYHNIVNTIELLDHRRFFLLLLNNSFYRNYQ